MPARLIFAVMVLLAATRLCSSAFAQDLRGHVRAGRNITPEKAASLEADLATRPQDLFKRAQLVGYYFRQFQDQAARAKLNAHILWLIKNAPESNVLAFPEANIWEQDSYWEGKEAWTSHLENDPNNLKILEHAANFFGRRDRQLAIEILEHAQSRDESDPHWARRLGQLHRLDSRLGNGKRDPEAAERALAQFERAYELSDELRRGDLLKYLGTTAFNAGAFEKAMQYAESMLQGNRPGWDRGNRIHYGNITLGRIALLEGNIDEARLRLVAAGKTPGSPQLNSFGPDMTLASELLQQGESEVVLEYLSLCSKFWKLDRGRLEAWISHVKDGETPGFGGSLRF